MYVKGLDSYTEEKGISKKNIYIYMDSEETSYIPANPIAGLN